MGGLVAISTLPSDLVSAVITMSSPSSLPPARFDRRVEDIYHEARQSLRSPNSTSTPILSLCGGATDSLIPSETCFLPPDDAGEPGFRRVVFTSGLEGAWTGVGHNEMVWCHQIRSRVARAAVEVAARAHSNDRRDVFERLFPHTTSILSDEHPRVLQQDDPEGHTFLISSSRVALPTPSEPTLKGSHMYLLPPLGEPITYRLTALIIRGHLTGIPRMPTTGNTHFGVTIHRCTADANDCKALPLTNASLTRLPAPLTGKPFPIPEEGADPDDTALALEMQLPDLGKDRIGVRIDGHLELGYKEVHLTIDDHDSPADVQSQVVLDKVWNIGKALNYLNSENLIDLSQSHSCATWSYTQMPDPVGCHSSLICSYPL